LRDNPVTNIYPESTRFARQQVDYFRASPYS
jgi:hypothetical protein